MTAIVPQKRTWCIAGLAVATFWLAGCAPGVAQASHGEVALFVDAGFLTGDEALITGTLTLTSKGCVGIETNSGETYPAVWPTGTVLTDDSGSIRVPGLGAVNLGDDIRGGGGFYSAASRPQLSDLAKRCDWSGEVAGIRFD